MSKSCYRVMRYDDGRTFSTVHYGRDAHAIIAEAVAVEFDVNEDELYYDEERDANGDWTGYEIICANNQKLARVLVP